MNGTDKLEDRLRSHYHATADELRLPPLEFSDLVEGRSAMIVTTPRTDQPRRVALLAAARDEVDATAVEMPLRPSSIGDRNRRRLMPLVAAAASLLLITAGIWAISSRHANDSSVQVGSAPTASQPLLVPPGSAPKGASIFAPAGRHTAVVVSPSGAPYTIDLLENFWGTMPADTATRTINNRTFGLLTGDLNTAGGTTSAYAALDQCSMTITKGSATATPWTAEALALLGAEQSDNGVIAVDLPAGWAIAVPSGAQASSYDYTLSNGVAGGQTTIVSTPSATAATAFSLYGPPAQIQRADFDGHTAWYSTYLASNNGTQAHLTWEAAGNAYDITARDATQDLLIAFARTLVPISIADFESTNPDQPSNATVGSTAPAPAGGCPTRALNVTSTPG